MKKQTAKLIDLARKNIELCEWCAQKTPEQYFEYMLKEVKELEEAFLKKDFDNVEEELGDIIWVCLVLAFLAERDKKINPIKMMERILKKIANRKPWLITGQIVSAKEAEMIWNEAKKKEKAEKNPKTTN